jgi:hypothetical protein
MVERDWTMSSKLSNYYSTLSNERMNQEDLCTQLRNPATNNALPIDNHN